MNVVQNYGNSYYNYKSYSPNFKAYNLKEIKAGLENGIIPTNEIIKEMKDDLIKLGKSSNIDDQLKTFSLSNVLSTIGKLRLQANKAELQLKINTNKILLATATPAEKLKIEQIIAHCEDLIKQIEENL